MAFLGIETRVFSGPGGMLKAYFTFEAISDLELSYVNHVLKLTKVYDVSCGEKLA